MRLTPLLAAATLAFGPGAELLAQGSPRSCGRERWPVKIAIDADAERIDTVPVRSTVADLGELPRPDVALPPRQRAQPYELKTFHVIAAVREVISESDGDLHVVLQDLEDPTRTMVAEVPDSACALGSRYIHAFADSYRTVRSAPRQAIVIIDGVGFFDFMHGQRGVAPNGFELHPIIAIRVVGQLLADQPALLSGTRAVSADTSKGTSTKVWVNTASMVYHCQGSRWYGATKRGSYLTEREAMAAGARPAFGRRCGG